MIRCGECQEFISVYDKYCWGCGVKNVDFNEDKDKRERNSICPKCHKVALKEADVYCRDCGTNLKTGKKEEGKKREENLCPKCKTKFDKDDKFCENCGTKLD